MNDKLALQLDFDSDRGHRKLDGQQASPKITKRHFFQDNQVSF